jgi:hypothetical protein
VGHEHNDLRSLEYHRAIATRLGLDPAIVSNAQGVVRRWREQGNVAPYYVERWAALLVLPVPALAAGIVAETEDARALRQVSPFTRALSPHDRWEIWRRTRHVGARDDTRAA